MTNPQHSYAYQLTEPESLSVFIALVVIVALVFGFIPAIRRSSEEGKKELFTCRATWSYGSALVKQYASFCRITVYEDFLLVVLLAATKYEYKKIKDIRLKNDFGGTLEMEYEGCTLSFSGSEYNMKQLQSYLMGRIDK